MTSNTNISKPGEKDSDDCIKHYRGHLLEDMTWQEAEKVLTPDTIMVLPLGAAAKEHGPHLKLKNDWTMAEYLKKRVLLNADVVVAPTVNYHYYPAFVEYPGSTTLSPQTACNLIVEICLSLAHFGPWRFYILNTGISTIKPLEQAKEILANNAIVLTYSNLDTLQAQVKTQVCQQEGGSHADEVETSMMLYIDPRSVEMGKAAKDYDATNCTGPLTRAVGEPGKSFSGSGVWGDATLATEQKGKLIVEATVEGLLSDIAKLRQTKSPATSTKLP